MSLNANLESEISGRRSLIGIRLQMLVDLFGKRVSEEGMLALRRVYGDALENFSADAISKAFAKAEQHCERFPTPKSMIEMCAENSVRQQDGEELGKYCKHCYPDGWRKRERADMPGYYFVVRCECQSKAVQG